MFLKLSYSSFPMGSFPEFVLERMEAAQLEMGKHVYLYVLFLLSLSCLCAALEASRRQYEDDLDKRSSGVNADALQVQYKLPFLFDRMSDFTFQHLGGMPRY